MYYLIKFSFIFIPQGCETNNPMVNSLPSSWPLRSTAYKARCQLRIHPDIFRPHFLFSYTLSWLLLVICHSWLFLSFKCWEGPTAHSLAFSFSHFYFSVGGFVQSPFLLIPTKFTWLILVFPISRVCPIAYPYLYLDS